MPASVCQLPRGLECAALLALLNGCFTYLRPRKPAHAIGEWLKGEICGLSGGA